MLVRRCAWCERYAVAEEWVPEHEAVPAVAPGDSRVSHGICPDCVDGLPRAGQGV